MIETTATSKPHGSLSPEELLAAIRRHQQVMGSGEEGASSNLTREVSMVSRALEAYWAGARRDSGLEPIRDLEIETAAGLRSLAAGFAEASPKSGFWRDAVFATLPVATAVATVAVPIRLGAVPPLLLPVVGVTVSAVFAVFLLFRSRRVDNPWPRWKGSLGALAGGMVVAALVGVSSYDQALKTMSMKLSMAEERMSDFAVASLAAAQRGGSFLPAPIQHKTALAGLRWNLFSAPPTLSVATETANSTEALYRGNASGVPGELVLRLEPGEGQLEWRQPGKTEVRERFVVGKLGKRQATKVEVVAESGTRLWLELGEQVPLALVEGTCLVACFSAETRELKAFQPVSC